MNNNWLGLEERSVIITGASSGIGYATACAFLEAGARVALCDINPPTQLTEYSGRWSYIHTDVTDMQSVDAMVTRVCNEFGSVDILVNNAGINIPRLLVDKERKYELDESVWDKVVNVNLKGIFFCTQAVAREMIRCGSGVILNMSSESGLEGSEGQSVYAATKNAINSLTRSWAKELGKKGIRVVGIAPGILEATGLRTQTYEDALAYTRGITVEQLRSGYSNIKTIPLGRVGKLSEVADVAVYLASDRASYIHGVTINAAGGKTRG